MKAASVVARGVAPVVMLLVVIAAAPAQGATSEQVDKALTQAKDYLYKHQKEGNWEEVPQRDPAGPPYDVKGGQFGGLTAIATYALLASGDDPQSEHVKPAIEWLKTADIVGLYALGMRCQVWELWGLHDHTKKTTDIIKKLVEHDGNLILASTKGTGDAIGLYDYLLNVPGMKFNGGGRWDNSVSQYGVLGMWACAENGFEVPQRYWQAVEEAWIRHQDKSGGWTYDSNSKNAVKASMTAAGIASLFITQDYLHGNEGIDCSGNIKNPHIALGLEWMSKNFDEVFKMGENTTYSLYGIERIGVASGNKYFGTTDWFREGAEHLINGRGKDGSWNGHGGPIANTAFGILFLVRGSAPVLMNKLQYEIAGGGAKKPANWNQRPRDAANLAKWMYKQTETFLNWQIVNLDVPEAQLHDSPIMYVTGSQALDFTDEEVTKLREFCENGGLILFNADCGARAKPFVDSVVKADKLAAKMFPTYEFRELPQDHLIFNNQFSSSKWHEKIPILGLSNGTRELILVFPTSDPSRFWQTGAYGGHEGLHDVMVNIFLYVTDKQEPRKKDQTYIVTADPKVKADRTLKLARLKYPGNWDPEPGGWRRMAAVLHNVERIDLTTEAVNLGDGKLDKAFKVAHMTGTTKFHLSESQRAELKSYVEGGGTLIVDAAGGSEEFAGAAEDELAATLGGTAPDELKTAIQPTDALYTAANGKPIEAFNYRTFAKHTLHGEARGSRLRGVKVGGRVAVYFSHEDLSAGLVGQDVDGIIGYSPATATEMVQHILVQAVGGTKQPATKPTTKPATPATKPAAKPGAPKAPAKPPTKPPAAKPPAAKPPAAK